MEDTIKKPIADKSVYKAYVESDMYAQDTWKEKDMNKVNPPQPGLTDPVKYIEKEYPQTAESFKAIQKEQYELFCKKQMDYGPKNISVGTDLRTDEDVKLSLTGLWFRINDKIERLKQLVVFDKTAQNEPMIDAFSDLSVYGIIAQIVHRKKWGK